MELDAKGLSSGCGWLSGEVQLRSVASPVTVDGSVSPHSYQISKHLRQFNAEAPVAKVTAWQGKSLTL
jgi:hypothetical protein